jgi:chromosome segregation ATPase
MENRFEALENRFEALENRFEALENRFEALENRFEALENRLETVEKEIKETKEAVIKVEQVVHDKVGILFDADTRTQEQLAQIKEEIQFLSRKEQDNEKELFKIKSRLEAI